MRIVVGRGKNRRVYDLPCGALCAAAEKYNPEEYKAGVDAICGMLRIPGY